jgi:hypothetical protein
MRSDRKKFEVVATHGQSFAVVLSDLPRIKRGWRKRDYLVGFKTKGSAVAAGRRWKRGRASH